MYAYLAGLLHALTRGGGGYIGYPGDILVCYPGGELICYPGAIFICRGGDFIGYARGAVTCYPGGDFVNDPPGNLVCYQWVILCATEVLSYAYPKVSLECYPWE